MNDFSFDYKFIDNNHSKNPVLFLHGFWSSYQIASRFWKLLKEHDFYGLNLSGHGKTLIKNYPLSINELIDCAIAFINKFQLKNISLIVHSMSGGIATVLAFRMPEIFKEIIYLSPFNLSDENCYQQWKKYFFAQDFATYVKLIHLLYANGKKMTDNQTFYLSLQKKFKTKIRDDKNMHDLYDSFGIKSYHDELILAYQTNQVRSLVILGTEDQICPLQKVNAFFKKYPNFEITALPNTAHVAIYEDPDRVYQIFKEFNRE